MKVDVVNECRIQRSARVAALLGMFEIGRSATSTHRVTGSGHPNGVVGMMMQASVDWEQIDNTDCWCKAGKPMEDRNEST
ncbi:MAG: hypothetical protein ACE5F8_03945 [Woeseiaceae bacterium]